MIGFRWQLCLKNPSSNRSRSKCWSTTARATWATKRWLPRTWTTRTRLETAPTATWWAIRSRGSNASSWGRVFRARPPLASTVSACPLHDIPIRLGFDFYHYYYYYYLTSFNWFSDYWFFCFCLFKMNFSLKFLFRFYF